MANWRRLPGVLFANRYRAITLISFIFALFYGISLSGIVCSNHEVEAVLKQLCQKYASGLVVGNLCEPLCRNSKAASLSCTSSHNGKELVFSAVWGEEKMHFKSAFTPEKRNKSEIPLMMDEADFRRAVLELIATKLNLTVTGQQLERLVHLSPKSDPVHNRPLERQVVYNFLQSQEYLLSVLFSDRDVFPQVYGTCGHLYGVETLSPPLIGSYYIWSFAWLNRVKVAVQIMDMLEQLETDFPDPLHLCDVKFTHFGLTPHGRLKYIDLDQTHPDNILQAITASGQPCQLDTDCDLFDCKAPCNPSTKRCDIGVTNNNLQIICEKIFLGWTLSGKLMVPGLLMTVKTPPQLASLLRQCAENGRSAVPEDIRQRLYTTLTEMEQVLAENEN